ncbi:MAG: hypothetical protein ACPH5P_00385 [Akkermansiaceae bacterium]
MSLCFPLSIAGKTETGPLPFVSVWNVPTDNYTQQIGVGNATFDCEIDWGDGQTTTYATATSGGVIAHTYATAGQYTVKISGTFPRLEMTRSTTRNNLVEIPELGDVGWTHFYKAFRACGQLLSIHRTPGQPNAGNGNIQEIVKNCFNLHTFPPLRDLVDTAGHFYMAFQDARKLVEIDTTGCNVVLGSNSLYIAFNSCYELRRVLGAEEWNVTNVQRIDMMARSSPVIDTFDTSTWVMPNCLRYSRAFTTSNLLLDYRNWDISKMRNDSDMLNCIETTIADDDIWSDALIYWSTLTFVNSGLRLKAPAGSKYRADAQAARDILTSAPNNHIIYDAGPQ